MRRVIVVLCVAGLLSACSPHPAATPVSSIEPAAAATNVLAGTPMAAYGHALNKAKNVQNVVNAAAAKQAAAIDAATGSSSR